LKHLPGAKLLLKDLEIDSWTYGYRSRRFDLEWFVYLKLSERSKTTPVFKEFKDAINQCPFACAADPEFFYSTVRFRTHSDIAVYQNRVLLMTVVFSLTTEAILVLKSMPFLNLLAHLLKLVVTTLPRVYANANLAYWLAHGESSEVISQLMPRDKHAFQKILSVSVIDSLPIPYLCDFGPVIAFAGRSANFIGSVLSWRPGDNHEFMISRRVAHPWEQISDRIQASFDEGHSKVLVVSETGTGKSYYLPRFLKHHYDHLFLLVPRKALRDELNLEGSVILTRGVAIGRLNVCTAGHFARRFPDGPPDKSLVLLDEIHEETVDQQLVCRTKIQRLLYMTATPVFRKVPEPSMSINTSFERPYRVQQGVFYGTDPTTAVKAVVSQCPKFAGRFLIIVPSIREANATARTMVSNGFVATVWSSQSRQLPETGHIVATQIADAGINIPGITCVIDSGDAILNVGGDLVRTLAPPELSRQRMGRTGRFCDGLYVSLKPCGSLRSDDCPSAGSVLADPVMGYLLKHNHCKNVPDSLFLVSNAVRPSTVVARSTQDYSLGLYTHLILCGERGEVYQDMINGRSDNEALLERLPKISWLSLSDVEKLAAKTTLVYLYDDGFSVQIPLVRGGVLDREERLPLPPLGETNSLIMGDLNLFG